MKHKFLTSYFVACIIGLCALHGYAQDSYVAPPSFNNNSQKAPTPAKTDSVRKVYLGLGTGVNNYIGMIGVGVDISAYN